MSDFTSGTFTVACVAEDPFASCVVSCASLRTGGVACSPLVPRRNDDDLCECNRPDEADNPHRHTFDVACLYWLAGRPTPDDLKTAADQHFGSSEPAVPLLGGLLADSEDGADLRPGVLIEEPELLDLSLDVGVDVLAPSDEGLEVGFGADHASTLVDAGEMRQEVLTAGANALHEAANALEGGLGVEGIPRNLYEFRQWLRARADRVISPAGGNS